MILMLFVPSTGVYATLQGSLCLSHRSMKATGNIKHNWTCETLHWGYKCYSLMALDLLIDDSGAVWLLEANSKPALHAQSASLKVSRHVPALNIWWHANPQDPHRFVDERHTVSYRVIQIHTVRSTCEGLCPPTDFFSPDDSMTRLVFQRISTSKAIFPVHFAVKAALLSGTKTHFCPWIFVALRQVQGRYTSQLPSCACYAKIT